jgi:hypothetical protein
MALVAYSLCTDPGPLRAQDLYISSNKLLYISWAFKAQEMYRSYKASSRYYE